MSWRTEWKAISDRFGGLLDAGRFFLEVVRVNTSDPARVADKIITPQARELFQLVVQFRDTYRGVLPTAAAACLERFVHEGPRYVLADDLKGYFAVQAAITAFGAFCAEFTYHLSDTAEVARRLSERAFLHLQRSIVADRAVGDRWRDAFDKGERACEQLGSVHLLQHGIWAFKADAAGERTDLLIGEPFTDLSEVERSAEALVLTEWKLARTRGELAGQLEQAFQQATRYAAGSLGGLELAQYRYLVLVSQDHVRMPQDRLVGDVVYRHVNIAVEPSAPSATRSRPSRHP